MKKELSFGEFNQRLVEDARKVIATRNGTDITNLDSVWLRLKTIDSLEAKKLQIQYYAQAIEAEERYLEHIVSTILAHKEKWGREFELYHAMGRPLPSVWPHPDDVTVLSATTFRVDGPLTRDDARWWTKMVEYRRTFITIADEMIESAGLFRPVEVDYEAYLKLRRKFYRANRHLPIALKRKHPVKFPSFKPPAKPPAWFSEYDE